MRMLNEVPEQTNNIAEYYNMCLLAPGLQLPDCGLQQS